jgi:UTP--glucose-1-phosphate uridylyltransferase
MEPFPQERSMVIRKVVIPVAGWGTRSLPASKNIPKEMLPIYKKPVIQYVVEEAMVSGIKDVVFITNRDKSVIEDHFDYNLQLEGVLERSGKYDLLRQVRFVAEMVNIMSVRQKRQLGLGHAVLCAESVVGDEPFAVMVGDDLIFGDVPGIRQLIMLAESEQKPVIGIMEVAPDKVNKYGIVEGTLRSDGVYEITGMVEKPAVGKAPSNLAIIGRYVLTPDIFRHIHAVRPGHGGEIQLTDAMRSLAAERGMLGVKVQGARFDAGDWEDYLIANLYFALEEEHLHPGLLARVRAMLDEYPAAGGMPA